MRTEYFKRVIEYDAKTQNYIGTVPQLDIKIFADTEMSCIIELRKEVENVSVKKAKQCFICPQVNKKYYRRLVPKRIVEDYSLAYRF